MAFIKPNGFTLSNHMSQIHGITQEILEEKGIPIQNVLDHLINSIKKYNVTCLVAHNLAFDYHVVLHEFYKQKQLHPIAQSYIGEQEQVFQNLSGYCTLKKSRLYCNAYGFQPNSFRLADIYKLVVGDIYRHIQLHRADSDIVLCKELYYTIKDKPIPPIVHK